MLLRVRVNDQTGKAEVTATFTENIRVCFLVMSSCFHVDESSRGFVRFARLIEVRDHGIKSYSKRIRVMTADVDICIVRRKMNGERILYKIRWNYPDALKKKGRKNFNSTSDKESHSFKEVCQF